MTPASSIRSWLFVPGDSARKQDKAASSGADALILDLEDSVAAELLPAARARVCALLRARAERAGQALWVRVNALSSGKLSDDLASVMPGAPDGVVLPKVSRASELTEVDAQLAALERKHAITPGTVKLLVIATETPQAIFSLGEIANAGHARLAALTWGAEDLSAALGATARDDNGALTFTFELARSMCLLAAAAAEVACIDGVCVDFRDAAAVSGEAARACRDGFSGKLAIHPAQVPCINSAFSPQRQEVERAQKIVAAFAAAPQAGVLSLDGQMLDRPHLLQAQRILARAARAQVPP